MLYKNMILKVAWYQQQSYFDPFQTNFSFLSIPANIRKPEVISYVYILHR